MEIPEPLKKVWAFIDNVIKLGIVVGIVLLSAYCLKEGIMPDGLSIEDAFKTAYVVIAFMISSGLLVALWGSLFIAYFTRQLIIGQLKYKYKQQHIVYLLFIVLFIPPVALYISHKYYLFNDQFLTAFLAIICANGEIILALWLQLIVNNSESNSRLFSTLRTVIPPPYNERRCSQQAGQIFKYFDLHRSNFFGSHIYATNIKYCNGACRHQIDVWQNCYG